MNRTAINKEKKLINKLTTKENAFSKESKSMFGRSCERDEKSMIEEQMRD